MTGLRTSSFHSSQPLWLSDKGYVSKEFAGPESFVCTLTSLPALSCLLSCGTEAFADAKPTVGDDKMAQRVKSL
ncbi:rCG60189 [Rattus norvegicus]|uniref:RCG60189 n=1 Tax=Rattus norvegicus TaxID=10116 RepID=A6HS44_RAT|nr:rCG60189 [Rattus norvegicus]